MAEENQNIETLTDEEILKYYNDIIEFADDEMLASACGGARAAGCSSCVYGSRGQGCK